MCPNTHFATLRNELYDGNKKAKNPKHGGEKLRIQLEEP
jgi:hypothetical protein